MFGQLRQSCMWASQENTYLKRTFGTLKLWWRWRVSKRELKHFPVLCTLPRLCTQFQRWFTVSFFFENRQSFLSFMKDGFYKSAQSFVLEANTYVNNSFAAQNFNPTWFKTTVSLDLTQGDSSRERCLPVTRDGVRERWTTYRAAIKASLRVSASNRRWAWERQPTQQPSSARNNKPRGFGATSTTHTHNDISLSLTHINSYLLDEKVKCFQPGVFF